MSTKILSSNFSHEILIVNWRVFSWFQGTDFLEIKIYLIGVFAASIAILSIYFNTFFTIVFTQNPSLRRTPIYYFGILAIVDIIMAFNYIALMVVPVSFTIKLLYFKKLRCEISENEFEHIYLNIHIIKISTQKYLYLY